jgi:hypothetical protein
MVPTSGCSCAKAFESVISARMITAVVLKAARVEQHVRVRVPVRCLRIFEAIPVFEQRATPRRNVLAPFDASGCAVLMSTRIGRRWPPARRSRS